MLKSTDHFFELKDNPAIRYEMGAEEYGDTISPYLEEAVQIVELKQYGSFPNRVTIYVPDSIDSYSSYCVSQVSSACVIGNRLFMSPKLSHHKERISKILIHELSHLHLSQHMGRWKYQLSIPSWFSEGLAVYVSNGGGAENVSKDEAAKAIRSGQTIIPDGSGSLFFQKTANSFGLKPQMFYRQSSMYVEWLHTLNHEHFEELIRLLHKGSTVEQAMLDSYHFNVIDGWERFVYEIK